MSIVWNGRISSPDDLEKKKSLQLLDYLASFGQMRSFKRPIDGFLSRILTNGFVPASKLGIRSFEGHRGTPR
jgi:hypothetical protein